MLGFKLIAIAALFSTSSAINATLYGGVNVSYFIAKEGELPEIFERKVWGRSTEGLFVMLIFELEKRAKNFKLVMDTKRRPNDQATPIYSRRKSTHSA